MYRVLVFGMTENPGGVESFLINYYRKIDRKNIQFDFLCNSYEPIAYEDEVLALGAHTFHFPARSSQPYEYRKKLSKFFKEHAREYQVIWVNVCSLANIDYLKLARKYGIPKRIIHSHNSQNMDGKLRGMLHRWNKGKIERYATDFWACGEDAAKWFYSDRLLKNAVIIHNAIDVDRMRFDRNKRKKYREKLACGSRYVIGNVGRLHFQKNQMFLLEIFHKAVEKEPEMELVLIGQGEDEEVLREKTKKLGLEDKVHFMGMQFDIPGWLSAFDLFLFPSVFEGLGIAALEAEANGLPVLASETVIPEEVKMNCNFKFFSLNKGAEAWADQVIKMKNVPRVEAREIKEIFVKNGYDISVEVSKLEQMFL